MEEEIAWVQRAFKLAMEMGTGRIARELRAMGVTQAESDEPINKGDLAAVLSSVTVLGWRQNMNNNKPVGDPVKGVYPAIVTPQGIRRCSDRASVKGQEGHAQRQASPQLV